MPNNHEHYNTSYAPYTVVLSTEIRRAFGSVVIVTVIVATATNHSTAVHIFQLLNKRRRVVERELQNKMGWPALLVVRSSKHESSHPNATPGQTHLMNHVHP